MATGIVYGNGKMVPTIDRAPDIKTIPELGDNLFLMSREEFSAWLEKNNRTAKPIPQLIEEYKSSLYEDHRPSLSKSK